MRLILACITIVSTLMGGCSRQSSPPSVASLGPAGTDLVARGPVRTGAQVLADERFRRFSGKRIGLIANHTTMVDTVHLADLVHRAPGVRLVALFGPEHGLRGQADAGETITDGRDSGTGAPIYSLYGKTNKPTPEMLKDVDVLVFDVQDVGARFYTYISTMGLAMQAAAEAGIPFVVLDRPNPLGGTYVSGFLMEPENASFVGMYRIPIAHGLTVGELARMIKGERLLPGLEKLDLQVVAMEGWRRGMLWPETGLPWISPSPNINTYETALAYPGTCLFEATSASEGRGTTAPFLQIGAPGVNGAEIAAFLNARKLPGVRFADTSFTPESIPGMATDPKLKGRKLGGIRLEITDDSAFLPVETGLHVLDAFARQSTFKRLVDRPEWLRKLAGTDRMLRMFENGSSPDQVAAAWAEEVRQFEARRAPYLLYD